MQLFRVMFGLMGVYTKCTCVFRSGPIFPVHILHLVPAFYIDEISVLSVISLSRFRSLNILMRTSEEGKRF